jgi:endonuclease/exonuclease/phosphatase family metal-dependent hydrolase
MKLSDDQHGSIHAYVLLFLVVGLIGLIGVRLANFGSGAEISTNINVGTYNVRSQRWDDTNKNYATWDVRKDRVETKISGALPGIIGLQEVTKRDPETLKYLTQRNDVIDFMTALGYGYVVGDVDNSDPIFWRKTNFAKQTSGNVLIYDRSTSRLEDKPASRYLTYARLKQTDHNKYVLVFNYHFNQYEQTGKQLDKLGDSIKAVHNSYLADDMFFTGDFNGYSDKIIATLRSKSVSMQYADSYSGVDHVLISPHVDVRSWANKGIGSPAASDHPLILARLTI